jgi:hypothetical protein
MAKSTLLDFDTAKRKKVIYHEEDGKTYIETRVDNNDLVEGAKIMREYAVHEKDFKPVCVIPEDVLNRAFTEGWFHDKTAWKRWANDPSNKAFRLSEGRL